MIHALMYHLKIICILMKRIYPIALTLICLNTLHAKHSESTNPLRNLYNRAQDKLRALAEAEQTWTDEIDEDEEVVLDSVSQRILGEVKKLSNLDANLKAEIATMMKEQTGKGLNIPCEYGQGITGHLCLTFHHGAVIIQSELLCAEEVAQDSVMARLAQKAISKSHPYAQGCSECQIKGILSDGRFVTHRKCDTSLSIAQFAEVLGIAQQ